MNETAHWADEGFNESKNGKPIIFFHPVQKKNNFKSKEQNRPVFEEVIHITKRVPGDKDLVIDRPLREDDKDEFPEAWARWEKNRENHIPGIPIESWHSVTETQKAEFKALNIFTIEQFANLPDSIAQKIMGFYDLRKKAQIFIEAGKDAELMGRLRSEMADQMAAKDRELAELRSMIEAMTAPKKEEVTV